MARITVERLMQAAAKYEDIEQSVIIEFEDDTLRVLEVFDVGNDDKVGIAVVDSSVPLEQVEGHESYNALELLISKDETKIDEILQKIEAL